MKVTTAALALLAVFNLATARIVELDCGNTIVSKAPGDFSNVCVRNDVLRDSSTNDNNWNFENSKIKDVTFESVTFKGELNLNKAIWTNTKFVDCKFEGPGDGSKISFSNGALTDVTFEGCTFEKSVEMLFEKASLTDVTFKSCNFKTDAIFRSTENRNIVFEDTSLGGFEQSLVFANSTSEKLKFQKCNIGSSIRFESAQTTGLEVTDDTDIHDFYCGKPDGSAQSTFIDAEFEKTNMHDIMCQGSTWRGMKLEGILADKILLSQTSLSDLRWDGITTSDNSPCGTLDVSEATIKSGDSISGLKVCNVTFKGSKFPDAIDFTDTDVTNKDIYTFTSAEFSQSCVGKKTCPELCGEPDSSTKSCTCSSVDKSIDCTKAGSNVESESTTEADSASTSKEKDGGSCFPEDSVVSLASGESLEMRDLKHSDKVAIGGGRHSEVFFFGHRTSSELSNFVHIKTEATERELRLSPGHYLYANGKLVTSRTVQVGDVLETMDGKPARVTSVRTQLAKGKYAPATIHGNIVVDGIVVSSYTDAIHPRIAHFLLGPLRRLHQSGFEAISSRFTMLHEWNPVYVSEFLGFSGPGVVEKL